MAKKTKSAKELEQVVKAAVDGLITDTIEDGEKAIAGVGKKSKAPKKKAKR